MSKLRSRLTFANVMSVIAVFIALGGTGYAAFKLPKNSVGTKQLKKNSVTTAKIKKRAVTAAKVKDGTLTGKQINLAKLGTVPTANTADIANSLAAPEGWHEVGAPGEPVFQNSWKNAGAQHETVGFYKDQGGVVHLKASQFPGHSASCSSCLRAIAPQVAGPLKWRSIAAVAPNVEGRRK